MMSAVLETLYAEYKVLVTTYHDTVKKLNQVAELIKTYGGEAASAEDLRTTTLEDIIADIRHSLYPIDGTWEQKVVFTLERFPGQLLSASKIYDFVSRNEGSSFKEKDQNGQSIIYSTLSRMSRDKKVLVDDTTSKKRYRLIKS